VSSQPSLFDPPAAVQIGKAALERTAANHREKIEQLVPIARYLARQAGTDGITVADLREEAVRLGVLSGEEVGRELSYLGAVMKAAKLRSTGEYRRSHIDRTHGNLVVVWRAP
jgi:hypothetical protein